MLHQKMSEPFQFKYFLNSRVEQFCCLQCCFSPLFVANSYRLVHLG
jgi:hypothetical protein